MPNPASACIVLVYLVLNLLLNYYNAFLLGNSHGHLHLPIAIFYTMLHQVTIVIMTGIWTALVPSVRFNARELFEQNWAWLIFVSITYASSIATNNASFASISLTVSAAHRPPHRQLARSVIHARLHTYSFLVAQVNTIFKSAVPFPTMVFSYFIEGKTYSVAIIFIVAVLVGGTLLAVPYGEHKAESDTPEWIGYALVIFSMVATAIRPVITSKLMQNAGGSKQSLSAVSMAFFDAAIAICLLLPVALVTDIIANDGVQQTFINNDFGWRNGLYVAAGCLMAGVYGPVTFYTIKLTSSLSFIIIGNFKQLFLLAGAAIFVDHVVEPLLWIGVAVTALASIAYSYWTNKEKTEKQAADKAKKDAEAKLLAK